jgi:hypothetical protein
MSTNKMTERYLTLTKKTAEVSRRLRADGGSAGLELSRQIQAAETVAAAKGAKLDDTKTLSRAARREMVLAMKSLRVVNRSVCGLCVAHGVEGAAMFRSLDRGNEPGLAIRLEIAARSVPALGGGTLSKLVTSKRHAFETAKRQAVARSTSVVTASREFDAAVLALESLFARGRAVLASAGIRIPARLVRRARTTPDANSATASPEPSTAMPDAA